jgi:hypothetical protein
MIRSAGYKSRARKREEDFSRERKMPFVKLIRCMLSIIKERTQVALERFFDWQGEGDGAECRVGAAELLCPPETAPQGPVSPQSQIQLLSRGA